MRSPIATEPHTDRGARQEEPRARQEVGCPVGRLMVSLQETGYADQTHHDAVSCSARRWIALGVFGSIAVLGELAHWAKEGTGSLANFGIRLGFLVAYLPIQVNAISAAYDYTLRRRMGPAKTVGFTAVVSMSTAITVMTIYWAMGHYFPVLRLFPSDSVLTFKRAVAYGAVMGPVHLAIWVLAFVYPFAAHDARERALEAEKLRSAAELARLRGHLEPHFLLNTLNAIAGLVTEDPREARRLLACLGDLLRDALKDGDEMQTLAEEEAWLRRYAAILESRHKGSLAFHWEIDPSVKGVLMPKLLLQPLVENAVKHGALRRRDGGEVTVRAVRGADGQSVVCTVEDNGPGFPDRPVRQGALGLSVVRRRLQLKYEQASLDIESSTEGSRCIVQLAHPARAGAVIPALDRSERAKRRERDVATRVVAGT